jgi:BirA family biotin operon repressor/biotin-[acetyl-CoA-carboxylase] ligase
MSHAFLKAPIVHLEVVPSTSDLARGLLLIPEPPALPFAVTADLQTAARGRGTNTWYTDSGSFALTAAFNPSMHGLRPEHEPCIGLAFASLFIRALESLKRIPPFMAGIRWPNDLEAGGRKFCGLLPERIETPRGPRCLLGIGLNVATDLDRAGPEVARTATSIARLQEVNDQTLSGDRSSETAGAGSSLLSPQSYREVVLATLDEAVERLAASDPALPRLWSAIDLLRDRPIRVQLPDRVVQGVAAGIDDLGRLRVATEAGIETLSGGSVDRS